MGEPRRSGSTVLRTCGHCFGDRFFDSSFGEEDCGHVTFIIELESVAVTVMLLDRFAYVLVSERWDKRIDPHLFTVCVDHSINRSDARLDLPSFKLRAESRSTVVVIRVHESSNPDWFAVSIMIAGSNDLNKKSIRLADTFMVGRVGIEPTTNGLKGHCSTD